MAQLTIQQRQSGDVTILDLAGKIAIGEGAVVLRQAVHQALEDGKKKLVLHLANVSSVDSSGIGELVSAYTRMSNHGGALKLLALPSKVQDVLMITRLLTVFETFDSEQEALASFQ
ncbi:Anti-sigma F factor antagonist (spoIIAA-2) [Myxococcus hansupus]|uniref:Anti-sigma factor antagonist n=1 Tax=Pseudomyxococcus hansupus TaxID=1297742 RepID=A0A0H4XD80_9BACT|nr:STAS domain-containing protein [Myxococcus hansupus]AKQ65982.1 Anti-sigma F factor antagonist (spoIIAA-2) [Myxococcus hansupus]